MAMSIYHHLRKDHGGGTVPGVASKLGFPRRTHQTPAQYSLFSLTVICRSRGERNCPPLCVCVWDELNHDVGSLIKGY